MKHTDNTPLGTAWRLRTILIYSLLIFALLPATLVGGLMYSSTIKNVDTLSNKIISDVAYRVQLDTETHLLQAHSLLDGLLSHIPSAGQIQQVKSMIAKPEEFELLAFSLTRMLPDVSFLYFTDQAGSFYGVQQNALEDVRKTKIHIKTAEAASRQYFAALQALDRSQPLDPETKPYDARQRPWYQDAVKKKKRTFTAVYPSASTGQLLITLAQPVYGDDGGILGVVGADLFLKALTKRLQAQKISANGIAILVDEQGFLVATSSSEELFKAKDGQLMRIRPDESTNNMVQQTYAAYQEQLKQKASSSTTENLVLASSLSTLQGDKLIAAMRPFGQQNGLEWTMIVAAPDKDFAGETRSSIQQSVYVTLGVLALGAFAATLFAYSLSRRFAHLTQAAADLGQNIVPTVQRQAKIVEVRTLSLAMHNSALEIQTKRSKIEQQALALRDANEHLEERVLQRTEELAASREEALSAVKAKAAFLATMSHEIRTPLNGVVGMTSLLSDTPLNAEQKDYVQTMRVSSDQLLGVINDILDFSKIESGKLDLENEPLNLLTTIEEACDISASRAREKNLQLLIDVGDNVPEWVRGDVTRLRQVLLNYINNAIKFTHEGKIIVTVNLMRDFEPNRPALLEFRVKDSGIGIALDRQSALFQSFTQVDASTARRYGGTGLGLAICKYMAQLMGGQVGLESAPGQGSTFWFTAQMEFADALEPTDSALFHMVSLNGQQALLMDDTALNLRILDKQVKRWGVNTINFTRAAPALEWLEHHTVDIIVTDMHMPDMDGYEFAKTLRLKQPQVRIVLLTSGLMPSGEIAKMFDAMLQKPYRATQLFDAMVRVGSVAVIDKPVKAPPAIARKDLRILVADDNAINLKVVTAMLTKLGYDSNTVTHGQEAVDAVTQSFAALEPGAQPRQGYAAILMDANMPVMDGYSAARIILAKFGANAPPIIALTASVLEEDRLRSQEAGMQGFLAKPLRIDDLSEALEKLISSDAPRRSTHSQQTKAQAPLTPEKTHHAEPLVDWARMNQFKEIDDAERTMTRAVIALFIRDAPLMVADIQEAHQAGERQALGLAAHALQGAASNIGVMRMAQFCATLEAACAPSNTAPNYAGQVAQIADCLPASLRELQAFSP